MKSFTQSSKHLCTSLEYICRQGRSAWEVSQHVSFPGRILYSHGCLQWGEFYGGKILTLMNSFICFFSIRPCSSRCSDGLSLSRKSLLAKAYLSAQYQTYASMLADLNQEATQILVTFCRVVFIWETMLRYVVGGLEVRKLYDFPNHTNLRSDTSHSCAIPFISHSIPTQHQAQTLQCPFKSVEYKSSFIGLRLPPMPHILYLIKIP